MDEETKRILEDYEKRICVLEKIFKTSPEKINKGVSIKEFIISKNPKGDVQKALVIGYYLEKNKGMSSFNVANLEEGFRESKEQVPNNLNLIAIQNIKKGHFMESKEKKDNIKSWSLTSTGEKFVENDLKK